MLRIDTLILKIKEDAIKDINYDYFNFNLKYEKDKNKRDVLLQKVYTFNKDYKTIGLNNIVKFGNEIIIEISGKILKEDYINLINKNNIFKVVENINNKGISFDPYKMLDAEVLRFDVTNNIEVENNIDEYLKAIYLHGKESYKYNAKPYKHHGVTFIKNNITKRLKDRLVIYNKPIEIIKDKKMMQYIKFSDFLKVLRFETNLKNKHQIRKRLNIKNKDIYLKDILENKSNVNYKFINDVSKSTPEVMKYKSSSYNDLIKQAGYNHILESFNGDPKKAKEFIKLKTNKTTDPYYNTSQLKKYTEMKIGSDNKYIKEVKEKLGNAI